MIPVDNLVPLDTQLITPALADAFDLPYASNVTSKEPQSKDAPQGKEFLASDYPIATHPQTQAPSQNAAQQNPNSNLKQPSDFNYQVLSCYTTDFPNSVWAGYNNLNQVNKST